MDDVVVLMLVATLWGVVQLTLLGSLTRSVRLGTLLLAVAAGCYACGTAALALQLGWTRVLAQATGQPLVVVVKHAAYTVDPVIEEVVKVLLLVLVLALARSARAQWGLTDHLLLGAAIGAGFTFTEAVLHFGGRGTRAAVDHRGGFDVSTGLLSSANIPGPQSLLTTWLPAPARDGGFLGLGDASYLNLHLAWTSLAAFGLGVLLRSGRRRRWLGLLPLVAVAVDHAAYNYDVGVLGPRSLLVDAIVTIHHLLWLGPLLALVAATVLDLRATRCRQSDDLDLLLATERSGPGRWFALAAFARLAPPWTPLVAWRFALVRRSVRYAAAQPGRSRLDLRQVVVGLVDALDRAGDASAWREASRRLSLQVTRSRPRFTWPVVVWAVLLVPVLLYYVVGAVPLLAFVQGWLTGRAASAVIGVLSAAGLGWLGWQLVGLLRRFPSRVRDPWGEAAARLGLRLLTGLGALTSGVAVLALWLSGARSGAQHLVERFHILDALSDAVLVAAMLLVLTAVVMFPPFGLVALEGGGAVLVWTGVTAELAAAVGASALLGTTGVLLNEAGGGPSSGGSSGTGGRPPTRAERLEDLARDPADGGKINDGTLREAEVGLEMEEAGALRGRVARSPHEGADLVDGNGVYWDVKSFRSSYDGRRVFDLRRAMTNVARKTDGGTGVIIDTKYLVPDDLAALRAAINNNTQMRALVKWW